MSLMMSWRARLHQAYNKSMHIGLILILCLCTCLVGCAPEKPKTVNSIETIVGDQTLPHEGCPHGVPESFDWARRPRVGYGNNPGKFRAMTAWGQLYLDAAGSPATNTRAQIRDIRAYLLDKHTGKWRLLQQSLSVDGSAYREDFAGDVNQPADVRPAPDGGVAVRLAEGYNYYFWPSSGRAALDPAEIGGIFTTVQARLVVDDPSKPDDRDQAHLLLSMGGDYWLDLNAQWDQWKTNGDIAIGRFRYVTSQWQAFNMTTLNEAELRKNPPPIE